MTLIDLLDIIFNNLEEITDLEFMTEVLTLIKYSDVSYLEPIIEDLIKFFKANNRYPEFSYLKILGGDLIKEVETEYSPDFLIKVLNLLQEQAVYSKAQSALHKKDRDLAISLLQEQIRSDVKPIEGLSSAGAHYRQMKLRPPGLKTGIPEVDVIFRNFSYATMSCIVAPPKNGKTTVAISMFYWNLMNLPVNLVYFVLEGTVEEQMFNLISAHSKALGRPMSSFKIKSLELDEEEEKWMDEVIVDFEKNKKGNYVFIDPRHLSIVRPMEVTRLLTQIKALWNGQLDGVFADYIQEFKYYRVPGITEEKAVINYWVRYWHDICISMNFIMVLLAQMNREGEAVMRKTNQVTAKALAEANELERACARVFAISTNEIMRQSNEMKIYFVYHRYGPIPAEPVDIYADFAHFNVGAPEFSSIRTLSVVEGLIETDIQFN